jgi:polyphosphate kinase 2 (PPK2 family)
VVGQVDPQGVRITAFKAPTPEELRHSFLWRIRRRLPEPGDLEVYPMWDAYVDAYGDALTRCNTEAAPWYVIPADRKWYRNWAVTRLLIEELERMELDWPAADFDVKKERARWWSWRSRAAVSPRSPT